MSKKYAVAWVTEEDVFDTLQGAQQKAADLRNEPDASDVAFPETITIYEIEVTNKIVEIHDV